MDSILNYLNTTTIGILSLAFISSLFLFRAFKDGNTREPPMAAGAWPILGHLQLLSKSKISSLQKTLGAMAEKYGPLFTIKLGAKKVLVLTNWEMAKEHFTKYDKVVCTSPNILAKLYYNKAMFSVAPYGPYLRELRKIVTLELLSNRRIELLGHVRVSEVEASIKELYNLWSNRKNESGYVLVEMKKWFSQLTSNIILRTLVGKRLNEEKAERFIETIRKLMTLFEVFPLADAIPFLRWLDLGGHDKAVEEIVNKELDEILCEWLEEHRQNRDLSEKKDAKDQDFMDVMLSVLNDAKIYQFDDILDTAIIKTTSMSVILGGNDTTSSTLTWTTSLILRNPGVLKKVKEELDSQIGRERCVSETDINKLIYLQALVKETLRLYPSTSFASPYVFTEDSTLGGYLVRSIGF